MIRGFNTTILYSKNVLKTARKYYNCDSLTGMQMENQVNNINKIQLYILCEKGNNWFNRISLGKNYNSK